MASKSKIAKALRFKGTAFESTSAPEERRHATLFWVVAAAFLPARATPEAVSDGPELPVPQSPRWPEDSMLNEPQ